MAPSKRDYGFRQRYRSDCPSPEPIDERGTICEVVIPPYEKRTFCGVVVPKKRTNADYEMPPKRLLSSSGKDTAQKKIKLSHKAQKNDQASIPISVSSSESLSEVDLIPEEIVETNHNDKVEAKKSNPKPPAKPSTIYAYPLLNRRRAQGKPDNAAGPSYAIHDPSTQEISGDTRAEMPYLAIDTSITDDFTELWNSIDTLSKDHFSDVILNDKKQEWLQSIPQALKKKRKRDLEFVHLVNQIAVGGPCGVGSWEQIFLEPELRRGIVSGILWRRVQDEVFGKMLFGGTAAQQRELMKIEKGMSKDSEGFARTRVRGLKVREMLSCPNPKSHYDRLTGKGVYPSETDKACSTLTKSLHNLLEYITSPNHTQSPKLLVSLQKITHQAASLARLIRLDTETIYYFPFIEKDSPFKPVDEPVTYFSPQHEAWLHDPANRADATVPNPKYHLPEEKIEQIHRYQPLIRIITSPALETYRRGGWRPQDSSTGLRKRTLVPSRVILRWGRPKEKSSIPSGYQVPKRGHCCPASYMSFHEAVGRLGIYRDVHAEGTFGEARGKPWYLYEGDYERPEWEVEGYPVLGAKGTGNQPLGLEGFVPNKSLF